MSSLDSSVCGSKYECDGNVCRLIQPIDSYPENLRVLRYGSISAMDSLIHTEAFRDGQGVQHLIINGKEYVHPIPINCLRVDNGHVYINFSDKPFPIV
jgi:hypothetical protein